MKRKRVLIALTLASLFGMTAGYLALEHLAPPPPSVVAAPSSSGTVVVAARALGIGSVLGPADVRLVRWRAEEIPHNYARSIESVVGRGLITGLQAGEPLLEAKMSTTQAGGGLAIVIPPGLRAVSVKVDEVISVAGFVAPGTRVDVLVTLNPTAEPEEAATRVVLQNVGVLASGQTIERDADGIPQTVTVITLLVTPEQAEALVLGAIDGHIQLALRNTLDIAEATTSGAKVSHLVEVDRPAPARILPRRAVAAQPATSTVVTYNGKQRTVASF